LTRPSRKRASPAWPLAQVIDNFFLSAIFAAPAGYLPAYATAHVRTHARTHRDTVRLWCVMRACMITPFMFFYFTTFILLHVRAHVLIWLSN
jgi:hypothetical protein